MKKTLIAIVVLVILAAIVFFAFYKKAHSEPKTINGTVTYLDKMALPDNATITVSLLDITAADTPETVSETSFASNGNQVPFAFALNYDASKIEANHTYSLQAKIEANGGVMRSTTSNVPVLTNGAPSDKIELVLFAPEAVNDNTSTTGQTKTNDDDSTTLNIADQGINERTFRLVSVDGKDFSSGNYTISFKGGKIYAKFCNSMSGGYVLYKGVLTAKDMVSTMMACSKPAGLMEAEQTFSKMLATGARVSLSDYDITLDTAMNKMVFRIDN